MSEKDELAQTLAERRYTWVGKGQGNTTSSALAEALLASDWLKQHDRKVAAKAWEQGAIAAWNRSGKQVYGEEYEELNFIPLSLRETNPYEKEGASK